MTFGHTLEYDPAPEGSPAILCPDWWEQPVFIHDKAAYTRKDVVISAANKDAGAHIDNPDAKLRALQEGFWIRTVKHVDGTKRTEPLADNHLRMLRRFAEELRSSNELLNLADLERSWWGQEILPIAQRRSHTQERPVRRNGPKR